jgi:hypothetical protein
MVQLVPADSEEMEADKNEGDGEVMRMSEPVGGRHQLEDMNRLVRSQTQQLQQELGQLLDHLDEQAIPVAGSVERLSHFLLQLVDILVDYQTVITRAVLDEPEASDSPS